LEGGKKYREVMLSWSIADFENVDEFVRPVFFDRGIPELTGYANPRGAQARPCIFNVPRLSSVTIRSILSRRPGRKSIAPTPSESRASTKRSKSGGA
jgi:hypothetical protein